MQDACNAGAPGARGLLTGFGAGVGAGSSWTTCQLAFKGDDEAEDALSQSDKVVDQLKESLHRP